MQAVVLAAGRGTRMGNLTDNCPKPMLQVLGKNLLEWKIEALPEEIDEIIFVVGYKKEVIQNYFGEQFTTKGGVCFCEECEVKPVEERHKFGERTFKITYVEQEVLDGTMGSLALCKDILKEKFLVLMGDDIYTKASLQDLLKYPLGILGIKDDIATGGKIFKDERGVFVGLKEGVVSVGSGEEFVNCGAYLLDKRVFEVEPILVKEGEYGLPHTMLAEWQQDPSFKVYVVETKEWINITSPESIKEAENLLK